MDTNPSYGVGEDRTTVFSTTKADHSLHDATTEEYDCAYAPLTSQHYSQYY